MGHVGGYENILEAYSMLKSKRFWHFFVTILKFRRYPLLGAV